MGMAFVARLRSGEDDQHRAVSKQLAKIIDRYGTTHVLICWPMSSPHPIAMLATVLYERAAPCWTSAAVSWRVAVRLPRQRSGLRGSKPDGIADFMPGDCAQQTPTTTDDRGTGDGLMQLLRRVLWL
jgi:hypothetical protein